MKTYYKVTINNKEYILTQMDYEVLLNSKVITKEDVEIINK
jgi:hypothetical protein